MSELKVKKTDKVKVNSRVRPILDKKRTIDFMGSKEIKISKKELEQLNKPIRFNEKGEPTKYREWAIEVKKEESSGTTENQ